MDKENPNKTFKNQNLHVTNDIDQVCSARQNPMVSKGHFLLKRYKEPTQEQVDEATRVIIGHMKKGGYDKNNHGIIETINRGATAASSVKTEAEVEWNEDEDDR